MAKWKEFPSPEAIVRAALERAARCIPLPEHGTAAEPQDSVDILVDSELRACEHNIRALASDPAEVAAIIKKAGETNET
jgi:hypothetical protein